MARKRRPAAMRHAGDVIDLVSSVLRACTFEIQSIMGNVIVWSFQYWYIHILPTRFYNSNAGLPMFLNTKTILYIVVLT